MDLFDHVNKKPRNLLPQQGEAYYYGAVVSKAEADSYFQILLREIQWKNDEAMIFGKKILTKRKVAWYADSPFNYTYSSVTKKALPWIPVLQDLKEVAESVCGESFNSCLLNLYHDGSEGMGWHNDGERELKKNGAIGSLSFGAERRFSFKHKKTKQKISKDLEHGSFLIMRGETQKNWMHQLPSTKLVQSPRINLTFRTIIHQPGRA